MLPHLHVSETVNKHVDQQLPEHVTRSCDKTSGLYSPSGDFTLCKHSNILLIINSKSLIINSKKERNNPRTYIGIL